jgi:hypothetical protein
MHHYYYKKYFQHKTKSYFTGVIFLAIIFFGFFGLAGSSLAATYYVATTGDDSTGNGSIGTPWRTPAYGAGRLSTGDTLYIKTGTYNITTNSVSMASAITPAAENCTIAAYPGESVTIRGNGGSAPTNGVIGSFDGSNVRNGTIIDGLTIQGIVVMIGTDVTVKNSDISVGGDSWSGIGQGEAVWVTDCTDCKVQNNKIHDNTSRSGNTNSALIMAYVGSNLLIENNEFYNSAGPALTLKDSLVNITAKYNYFHDNAYGGIWTANQGNPHDFDIYQNIFNHNCTALDPEYGAITFVTKTYNVRIYNNTFYGNHTTDFLQWTNDSSMSAQFWNNISSNPVNNHLSFPYSSSFFPFTYMDYNAYFNDVSWRYRSSTYTTISAWRTGCQALLAGCDANSIITDQAFLNGSGAWNTPADWKRSSYPTNGRGGSYASVMGAYITGNEVIGYAAPESSDTTPPAAPSGLSVN